MTLLARSLTLLRADHRGATVTEFALVAPVLLAMLLGVVQLGVGLYAQAGLKSAVEDAARYATLWPAPTETQIKARITANQFGMDSAQITGPTVTFSSGANPAYVTITMGYNLTINYVLGTQTIALSETRRAFIVS